MSAEINSVTLSQNLNEEQYLDLIRKVLKTGSKRVDRTGVGTISIFGAQMRYNLRNNILPLLTTKRVFFRGVAEELLWFVRGSTNAKDLQQKNVHIWDGNSTREFLDTAGFTDREEGDLGPVYGFQWRHFGAKYKTCYDDYSGQGVDQLTEVIRRIQTNPSDRRIILSAWNPMDIPQMALPPCHCLAQFFVADGELSCQLYQRSADVGLGVPFNIASYALLTHMIAHVTGLKAGDFVHTTGDTHIYLNHIKALEEQLKRTVMPCPTIHFKRPVKSIDDFQFNDMDLRNYNPHPAIKMELAV